MKKLLIFIAFFACINAFATNYSYAQMTQALNSFSLHNSIQDNPTPPVCMMPGASNFCSCWSVQMPANCSNYIPGCTIDEIQILLNGMGGKTNLPQICGKYSAIFGLPPADCVRILGYYFYGTAHNCV